MKKLALGATALACLATSMSANAATAVFDDFPPGSPVKMGGTGEPDRVDFGIDYDASTWASINSAILSIFITDTNALGSDTEVAGLGTLRTTSSGATLAPTDTVGPQLADSGSSLEHFFIDVSSLIGLGGAYALSGELVALSGDFYFDNARLTVDYNPVPVPAAVWLFGSALAGLGFARRRNSHS